MTDYESLAFWPLLRSARQYVSNGTMEQGSLSISGNVAEAHWNGHRGRNVTYTRV